MGRFFLILIIGFQIYCFYHIYKHKNQFYWYIIIFLFPLIGGLAYFFIHILDQNKIDQASEQIGGTLTMKSKTAQMEEIAEFADTIQNKIRLAEAYMEEGQNKKAIDLLLSCKVGIHIDDEEINSKLLQAYFSNEDYKEVISLAQELENYKFFKNSQERIAYAWSLFEMERDEEARAIFEEMNIPNTNYQHRKEYAKFLIELKKFEEASIILKDLNEEITYMDVYEKKLVNEHITEIKQLSSNYI